MGNGIFYGIGNLARVFINVPQPVGLVKHHQIPVDLPYVNVFCPRKMVRTDYDLIPVERIQVPFFDLFIERFRLKDEGGEKKLV